MSMEPYNLDQSPTALMGVDAGAAALSPHGPQSARANGLASQQPHTVNVPSRMVADHAPAAGDRRRGGFSVRSFLKMIFSRWKPIAGVSGLILAGTVAAIIYMPPHYASEAKLLVRLGRESVVIDPTARIGQAAVPMEGRDKEINSEIELLKSRKLIESIVESLGANRILGINRELPTTAANVSAAVKLVEDKLAIEAIPDSDILSIHFESRDPQLAHDLVAKLIEVYLDERADIYREPGDLKFFEDQLATARDQQAAIQSELRDLRDSSGVSDTTQQRLTLITRINELQSEIDTDSSQRTALANSLMVVTRQIGSATAAKQRQDQIAQDSLLASLIESKTAEKATAVKALAWVNEVDVKAQKLQQEATLSAARVTQYAEAYEQARIDQAMGQQRLSNISVAEPPVMPLEPKAPNRMLLLIAGVFLAGTLGLGSAFVAEEMDHTVRRSEDLVGLGLGQTVSVPFVDEDLDPPVPTNGAANGHGHTNRVSALFDNGSEGSEEAAMPLRGVARLSSDGHAHFPHDGLVSKNHYEPAINGNSASSAASEAMANQVSMSVVGAAIRPAHPVAISPRLLASVQEVLERLMPTYDEDAAPRLIGVVGPLRGQGTSTIALHLAVGLVQRLEAGADDVRGTGRVLLLDADIESGGSSALAGVPIIKRSSENGSAHTPGQFSPLNKGVRRRQHPLDVLSAAMLPENALLGSQMPKLLRAMGQQYRHIVIDLPPITQNSSAARLAGLCSAIVVVCKANELRIETAQKTAGRLRDAHANIAVSVINQRRYPVPDWIYRRS